MAETLESYKISEIFSLIPEYDGNPIFLINFLPKAQTMALGNQLTLLVLCIENTLSPGSTIIRQLLTSLLSVSCLDFELMLPKCEIYYRNN